MEMIGLMPIIKNNDENMKQMKFMCAQPATLYYAWQVEVMVNNFIEMGVNPENINIIVWKQNNVIPDYWNTLASYCPARFFFYDQTRVTRDYISSIRPNLLKQHWEAYPELENDIIFYHDCDIIFTKPISEWLLPELLEDDVWYGSDTRWYIAHSYIKSKGQDVIDRMCELMNLEESLIEENELNCIGAQYLMKNVTWSYWDRVEKDCEILFKQITELNIKKKEADPTHHELQIWCADMWAVLWGAWRLGIKTEVHPNFAFSWGTSDMIEFNSKNIMHNAGVVDGEGGLFYKCHFMNKVPYRRNLTIKENTASNMYYGWVKKAGNKSYLPNE